MNQELLIIISLAVGITLFMLYTIIDYFFISKPFREVNLAIKKNPNYLKSIKNRQKAEILISGASPALFSGKVGLFTMREIKLLNKELEKYK